MKDDYQNSPVYKDCYAKTAKTKKILTRTIKGRLSPSRRAAIEAARRAVHNKCVKKLKLNVPLLKPEKKSKKASRRKSKRVSKSKKVSRRKSKRVSKSKKASKRKSKKASRRKSRK